MGIRENEIQQAMVQKLLAGDRRVADRLISLVENQADGACDLMKLVYRHTGKAMIMGITRAGGSGNPDRHHRRYLSAGERRF
jgi:putative protein kinase ArgK-like GTPase of G3E family